MADASSTLSVQDFEQVRSGVYCLLTGNAQEMALTGLFLNAQNLYYIFNEYQRRYAAETGWQVDNSTHRLDAFTRLVYDAYESRVCEYAALARQASIECSPNAAGGRHKVISADNANGALRQRYAQLVQQWNEATINSMLAEALKETKRKASWLRRVRDPLYGRRPLSAVHLPKPNVGKRENAYLFNREQMGSSRHQYEFALMDQDQ